MAVQLGLLVVWLLTGLLGTGMVDMVLEPDPGPVAQTLLVLFLPLLIFPALLGTVLVLFARQGRSKT